ncbi:MAG: hypothetical protein ABNH00_14560 [Dokdonia sp.]|jgi:hypothetical protein
MKNPILILLFLILSQNVFAQEEALLERLRAIHNSGTTFYNIDGIDFTSQTISTAFNEKNLKKVYRQNKVKKKEVKYTDDQLEFEHYKVVKREEFENGLVAISVKYFVKNEKGRITTLWFTYYDQDKPAFEREIIALIIKDKIPKSCFASLSTTQVDFVGRELTLGGNCAWMNVNNIQCPRYGQINWSIHASKESAQRSLQNQLRATKIKNGGEVIAQEEVDIIFEDLPTKALKVTYDLTGATSLLASMSGGKSLTIYYVSQKVRDQHVSCVLSFWNNDNINPSGLPPLLEEVMRIDRE